MGFEPGPFPLKKNSVVSQPLLRLEGGFYMSCSPCKAFLDSSREFNIAVEVLISDGSRFSIDRAGCTYRPIIQDL